MSLDTSCVQLRQAYLIVVLNAARSGDLDKRSACYTALARCTQLLTLHFIFLLLLLLLLAGIMLAAEPPEPCVMDRSPRRPGKRLLVRLLVV
jgi:hypothetical protein